MFLESKKDEYSIIAKTSDCKELWIDHGNNKTAMHEQLKAISTAINSGKVENS